MEGENRSADNLEQVLERALERVWAAQGREGTFAEFRRKHQAMTEEDRVRHLVESENRKTGNLHETDGYDCKRCLNRGDIWFAWHDGRNWKEGFRRCECWKARASIRRLKASGLEKSMKRFSEFEAVEEWQKNMLKTAQDYVKADHTIGTSLFIGGAVGGGKTHICTAVCRELLHMGKEVIYMPWVSEAARLKTLANSDNSAEEIAAFSHAEVLYIDDFLKPTGENSAPTAADIRLAYDIINYRYNNKLPTIVSSEKYMNELLQYDEATVSRLYERAKGFTISIGRSTERNYRLKMGGDIL